MNTNLLATADDPTLLDMDAPIGLSLESKNVEDSDLLFWRAFGNHDITYFGLPLFQKLLHQAYHRVTMTGRFDTERLAKEHRQQIYRSETVITKACNSVESLLLCLGEDTFALLDGATLSVFAREWKKATKVASEFRAYMIPDHEDKPGFRLVSLAPDGPHAELVEVDSCPKSDVEELALHYGDDFIAWEQEWLARLAKRQGSVTILVGPPGVGKTSYLKMLMARFIERFAFYYLPLSSFDALVAPQLVSFWVDQNRVNKGKTKLVIIEDAEELLLPRDEQSRAQVSNLLNIGDGFLGEHLKLHVIATTNMAARELDEAMQRPGRLIGTREFRRLTRTEAERLAEAKKMTLPGTQESWSLAEIYNGQAETLAPEASVGFASVH